LTALKFSEKLSVSNATINELGQLDHISRFRLLRSLTLYETKVCFRSLKVFAVFYQSNCVEKEFSLSFVVSLANGYTTHQRRFSAEL